MTDLIRAHRELLETSAVDVDVAVDSGCRSALDGRDLPAELAGWASALPGIVFPQAGPDGRVVHQLRPDTPIRVNGEDKPRKYVFASGETPVLAVHPRHRELVASARTVLVVEGTKQALAAVSCAPDGVLVVGITGCQGWRSGGVPLPGWNDLPIAGADVVVAFDADVATNPDVHAAAVALAEHLELLGAATVRFLHAPAGAKAGLDDYLASIAVERRRDVLGRLIDRAGKLGRKPAAKRGGPDDPGAEYFDSTGLIADKFALAILNAGHFALGPDGSVWTYRNGIFHDDEHALVTITSKLLGKRWRDQHLRTGLALVAASLAERGQRLPEAPIGRLVCVTNGMLNVRTGELHPHDPSHLAYAKLTVAWNPSATCPRFDDWLARACGSQVDDLLEAASMFLTPWIGQRKVLFLFGPSRSGKGTFLRVIEALVPAEHRSAVTLLALSNDRFAPARLFGRILNSAGDLSDHHVDDLATFKMLTGDDSVSGERKFRDAFVFRNTALFVFSANNPPTVSENSQAYLNRIRAIAFPNSFAGAEDASVEQALHAELEGILVRLVQGAQRWLGRGQYTVANPVVADTFASFSDAVAQFAAQALTPVEAGFVSVPDAHDAYTRWCAANGRKPLGRNNFAKRADSHIGARVRAHSDGTGARGWRGWRVSDQSEWRDDGGYGALVDAVSATSATSSFITPHEKQGVKEGSEGVVPREREEDPEVAEVADGIGLVMGHAPRSTTVRDDMPAGWVEMEF